VRVIVVEWARGAALAGMLSRVGLCSCRTMTAKFIQLRWLRIALGLLLLLLCIALFPLFLRAQMYAARRSWKNEAILSVARLASDKDWIRREIRAVGTLTNSQAVIAEGWLTDRLILMQDGEWLVYKSHCSKAVPHNVMDIFLAKGSDGKWYYSTFHFCVGMVVLRLEQETQPPSLAFFAHEYNLREFDGRSNECLKETGRWPASWREKKEAN
jgi:hypothetical protein